MDPIQKKAIHLRITKLLDSFCDGCVYRTVNKSHEHCGKNCPIGKELVNCSNLLLGKPVVHEPIVGEMDYLKKGRWSKDEEFYLLNHAKYFPIHHLAEKLNRSYKDVYSKLWRYKQEKKISISLKRKVKDHGLSG